MRTVALVRLNRTALSGLFPMLVLAGAAWADSTPQATINTYCVTCHNNRAKTGGLSLEGKSLDVSTDPEAWEKVVKKVQLGVMPRDLTTRLDGASAALRRATRTIRQEHWNRKSLAEPREPDVQAHFARTFVILGCAVVATLAWREYERQELAW